MTDGLPATDLPADLLTTLPADSLADLPDTLRIRTADADDRLDVVRVLDGAMLQTDDVPDRIRAGDVLVAVTDRQGSDGKPTESVVGAAVLETRGDDRHLDAVAVRRQRRGSGIGSALVVRAVGDVAGGGGGDGVDAVQFTAEFDADLREFYDGLGFEITAVGDGSGNRFRGTLSL